MKRDLTAFGRGWTRVWGKCLGAIWLVPGESVGTIVQYSPEIRISCALPPKKRLITAQFYKNRSDLQLKAEIETPLLLWSQYLYIRPSCTGNSWCACPTCDSAYNKHHALCYCHECFERKRDKLKYNPKLANFQYLFNLYALKSLETEIDLSVISLPNVDSSGKVCFGLTNSPTNLRAANNIFWEAPFNNDYAYQKPTHKNCAFKTHSYINGPHFVGKHKTSPTSCRRAINHKAHCKCPNKEKNVHLVVCDCYSQCRCSCECLCCLGQCKCVCFCLCCQNACSCNCACNLTGEFVQLIQQSINRYKTNVWRMHETIVGTGSIATNKPVAGVFITFDKKTLEENKNSVLNHTFGKCIIGFATRNDDEQWVVDLPKGQNLLLEDKEVYVH